MNNSGIIKSDHPGKIRQDVLRGYGIEGRLKNIEYKSAACKLGIKGNEFSISDKYKTIEISKKNEQWISIRLIVNRIGNKYDGVIGEYKVNGFKAIDALTSARRLKKEKAKFTLLDFINKLNV